MSYKFLSLQQSEIEALKEAAKERLEEAKATAAEQVEAAKQKTEGLARRQ